jgi:hypothetical protein
MLVLDLQFRFFCSVAAVRLGFAVLIMSAKFNILNSPKSMTTFDIVPNTSVQNGLRLGLFITFTFKVIYTRCTLYECLLKHLRFILKHVEGLLYHSFATFLAIHELAYYRVCHSLPNPAFL